MDIINILSGSLGIIIIICLLYFMYRNRFNYLTVKKMEISGNKVSRWMSNGASVGYYTT